MPHAGHVLIGTEGQFLDMDAAFCTIMHSDPEAIRGRYFLDLIAPLDRQQCASAIATLRETKRPFVITKRFLRDDGSRVWLRGSVSITTDGTQAPTVLATIDPVDAPEGDGSPSVLLDVARFLAALRRDRRTVCDVALFSEPGWDAVLAAYIAEAEGCAVDVATLATMLDHSPGTIERWIKALLQHGVLEVEHRTRDADVAKSYRLTGDTYRKLEAYLLRVRPRHRALAMTE